MATRDPLRTSSAADLVVEIGTEELPAAYLPGLIDQLGREAERLLKAHHLAHGRMERYGTPRRLVLIVRDLAAVQRKPGEEVRGPSRQAAYDADGKPTAALQGFLRSQGGALAQTKVVTSGKGQYIYLVKPPTTTPAAKVLADLLPQLVASLRAPKTMRWDASAARFARPIRWLLTLHGRTLIRWTFGALTSASKTWVGGPRRPLSVPVTSLDRYQRALQQASVILDQDARRSRIEQAVARVARQSRGKTAPEMVSHGLLEEVTFLVERPTPLVGSFDPKYLTLPREVLLASMAKYQRVFAIDAGAGAGRGTSRAGGALLPTFVAILEGSPKRPAEVRVVIERILNARLADSLLFWNEDHQRLPLAQMAKQLSAVTFHERLGSMAEKADRLHKLAAVLERTWRLSREETAHVRRACELAKADLVSTMVKEFPTLQGAMGKYYALDSGEPREVAQAIEEHYLPLGGVAPKTLIGRAVGLLDKFDTLASYFSIGITPTGDQDPFGLRRAAQGIVEIAWTVKRPLPLSALIDAEGAQKVAEAIRAYVLERLYTFAWPAPKPTADVIEAVLSSRDCDDLVDVMDRIMSLQQLDGQPGLRKAAKVIERTQNILRGAARRQDRVDPAQLKEPLEQALWDRYTAHEGRMADLVRKQAYGEATTLFGETFFEPLHEFFDKVLVNAPEEPLKQNRLALMHAINSLYTSRIADLSKLTLLQHEES